MSIPKYILLLQTVINELVKYSSVYSSFTENGYFPDIVFIVRIYDENKRIGTDAYNEIGHFISICIKDNNIYFIDHQVSVADKIQYDISYAMNNNNTIAEFLTYMFNLPRYKGYHYCDI